MNTRAHDLAAFFAPFALYLSSMLPHLHLGDSGELTVGAVLFAVSHVPGYPLLTSLGHWMAQLPLANAAWRCNFFSAFFGALAVWMTFRLLVELTGNKLISLAAALAFACTYTLWEQSLKIRAYPLNTFFTTAIIFLCLRWRETLDRRWLITAFFIFGLGLANHEILLVVATVPLVFIIANRRHLRLRDLMLALTFAVLGVSFYLYIPLRAATNPALNWGEPDNLPRLIAALTQQQYAVKMLNPDWGAKIQMLGIIGRSFIDEGGLLILALAIFGWVVAAKKDPALFVGFLLLIFTNIALRINYIGEDEQYQVKRYLISSYLSLIVGLGFALVFLQKMMASRLSPVMTRIVMFILLIMVTATPVVRHARANDQSRNWVAYEAWQNVLSDPTENFAVFVGGDNSIFPLWYLQMVEYRRPDVAVVTRGGFRSEWVVKMMGPHLPDESILLRPEFASPALYNGLFLSTVANLIDSQAMPFAFAADRIAPPDEDELFQQLKAKTALRYNGALTWWDPLDRPIDAADNNVWRFYQTASLTDRSFVRDHHTTTVVVDYGVFFDRLARQKEQHGDISGALDAYHAALQADPEMDTALADMGSLFARGGQIGKAIDLYNQAIAINPLEWRHFHNLSLILRASGREGEAAQAAAQAELLRGTQP